MRALSSNRVGLLLFTVAAGLTQTVAAQITEPDGFGPVPVDPRAMCSKSSTMSPNPNGTIGCTGTSDTGDFNCCSNTLDNMSLIGLFKYYESDAAGNVLIDFQKDARSDLGTFTPLCSVQGDVVMHGDGCQVGFGWYCVNDSQSFTSQPVIHPFITSSSFQAYAADVGNVFPTAWKNNDGAFLPKVGYSIAGSVVSDFAGAPDFQTCASKKIGFAIIGGTAPNGTGVCTQNKFTETRLNQIHTASGKPYIDALIYPSKKMPGRFYIGMEDLPTSDTKFNAPVPGKTWTSDGDFNDFVFTVEGVVCQGGNQSCNVAGQKGLCAAGVTSCTDATGVSVCNAVFQPQTEACNAIDDDCDGIVDNGTNLCPDGQFCAHGTCAHDCQATGEFACPTGQVCVDQVCVDSACAATSCGSGQRCVAGQCIDECSGVVCTAGQQCSHGRCIDLCDARAAAGLPACPSNFVCQNGACVPNCTCLPCVSPLVCQSDAAKPGYGRCIASNATGTGGAPSSGGASSFGGSSATLGSTIGGATLGAGGITLGGGYSPTGGLTATTPTTVTTGGNVGVTSSATGGAGIVATATSPVGGATNSTDTSSTACEAGHETCPCYGNDTCNAGLVCASHLCVALGTGGATASAAQDSGVKSGCSCRMGISRPGALSVSVLALGCLALRRRRRALSVS